MAIHTAKPKAPSITYAKWDGTNYAELKEHFGEGVSLFNEYQILVCSDFGSRTCPIGSYIYQEINGDIKGVRYISEWTLQNMYHVDLTEN